MRIQFIGKTKHLVLLLFLSLSLSLTNLNAQTSIKDSLVHVYETSQDDSVKLAVLTSICKNAVRTNDTTQLKYFHSFIEFAEKLNNKKKHSYAYQLLGYLYKRIADYETAISYFKEAIKIDMESENVVYLTRSYINIGNTLRNIGAADSAIFYFKTAIEWAKIYDYDTITPTIYNNIGGVFSSINEYDSAITYHFKGLEIAEALQNEGEKILNLVGIAWSFREMEQFDKAEKYLLQALEIGKSTHQEEQIIRYTADVYRNLGVNSSRAGKNEQALEYHFKALETFKKISYTLYVYDVLNNISSTYARLGNTVLSIQYALEAIQTAESIRFERGIIATKMTLGSIYIENNELNKAEEIFYPLLEKPEIQNDLDLKKLVYKNLSAINEKQNNYIQALSYFKEFKVLEDSIFSLNSSDLIAEYSAKFEADESEKKILKLQNEDIKSKLKIKKQSNRLLVLLFTFISAVLFLILINIILRQRQRNREETLKHEMNNFIASRENKITKERINAKEEERGEIAHSLHNGISGDILGLKLIMENIASQSDKDLLNRPIQIASGIYEEVRSISHLLMPPSISKAPFIEVVLGLLFDFKMDHNIESETSFDSSIPWEQIDVSLKTELYRILQEALNNIVKHSKADFVNLKIEKKDDNLLMEVIDNGVGIDYKKISSGKGIQSLKHRLEELGGEMNVVKDEKSQTNFSVRLPFTKFLIDEH